MPSVEQLVIRGLRTACERVGSKQVSLLHQAQERSDPAGAGYHGRRIRAAQAIMEAIDEVAGELEGGDGGNG